MLDDELAEMKIELEELRAFKRLVMKNFTELARHQVDDDIALKIIECNHTKLGGGGFMSDST